MCGANEASISQSRYRRFIPLNSMSVLNLPERGQMALLLRSLRGRGEGRGEVRVQSLERSRVVRHYGSRTICSLSINS